MGFGVGFGRGLGFILHLEPHTWHLPVMLLLLLLLQRLLLVI